MREKSKLLWIDKDPLSHKSSQNRMFASQRQNVVLRILRINYEVDLMYDLFSKNIHKKIENFNPDSVLTHMPYHEITYKYDSAIEILSNLINTYKNLPFLVYTGATNRELTSDENLKSIGVRGVVRKLDTDEEDATNIMRCLSAVVRGEKFVSFNPKK